MKPQIYEVLKNFPGRKVMVFGDSILDTYLEGQVRQICREAPVGVVDLTSEAHFPGGAANTAVNLADLGANVEFVSVIGRDCEGQILIESLQRHHVHTHGLVACDARRTLAKTRLVSGSQILLRFDRGTTTPIDEALEERLGQVLGGLLPDMDAVVFCDYGYGVFTQGLIGRILELKKACRGILIGDAKDFRFLRQIGLTAVKPNYDEAVRVLGLEHLKPYQGRVEQIQEHGRGILAETNAAIAAVTLDCEGSLIWDKETPQAHRMFAPPSVKCSAGAGDTFISMLTLALSAGADTQLASQLASSASAIAVSKDSTSSVSLEELLIYFAHEDKSICDLQSLQLLCQFYKTRKDTIVFTNGCFDILHPGHVAFLNKAKLLGDVLILGVNSDNSVRRLKGPNRPINRLEDRIRVLAALNCIDHIVAFEGDSPTELIELIAPQIFAKGGDYAREFLPEASLVEALGGCVRILPYEQNYSTTGIIHYVNHHRFVL